jgi:hypothetical protein
MSYSGLGAGRPLARPESLVLDECLPGNLVLSLNHEVGRLELRPII